MAPAQSFPRKRLREKTPNVVVQMMQKTGLSNPVVVEMLAAEGLAALPWDSRRQCMHYTACRNHMPGAVQPEQMSREQVWKHMLRCYTEAYPDADASNKCILEFGLVAKEKHKDALLEADKSDHHHIICFCTEKHYWRRIRKISAERYNIHLNAVAHDGYCSMFRYVREKTKHKPLHELDQDPYFSALHPKGEQLKALLAQGEVTRKARAARLSFEQPQEQAVPEVRNTFGAAFNWVVDRKLKGTHGALQLQADAAAEVQAGRPRLMEFVRKHRNDLPDQIDFIWELMHAPERLVRHTTPRPELLFQAATAATDPGCFASTCANGACKCVELYEKILEFQDVSSLHFRHSVFETLTAGRTKGNALMIVGGQDSGKTTVIIRALALVVFVIVATVVCLFVCLVFVSNAFALTILFAI